MKKENLHLLINSVVAILVAALLISSYFIFIPTKQIDKQLGYKVKLEEVEKGSETPKSIVSINKILKGKKEVGLLYEATLSNNYGDVKVFIAVDSENNIIASYSDVDQEFPANNHAREVDLYIKALKGSNMLDPKVSSDVTKPTVSITLGTLDQLLKDIAFDLGAVEELSAIEKAYGKEVIRGININTSNQVVLSVEQAVINNEIVGFIYVVKDLFNYDKDGEPSEGIIEMEIYLNNDNKLLGYDYLTYEHTGGFQKVVNGYLDSLISEEISIHDALNHFNQGDFTGATGSTTGVSSLLDEISTFINDGNLLTVEESVSINEGSIKFKREIKLGNNVVATLYELEKVIDYVTNEGTNQGNIKMHIVINNDLEITSYFFIEYDHTPGFKGPVDSFLNNLIVNKININNVKDQSADNTSSTYTVKGIKGLIQELAVYLEGGE